MANINLDKAKLIFGSAETRQIKDFANEKFITLEFPNQDGESDVGRGGKIRNENLNADEATLTLRLILGSPDDIFFTGIRADKMRSPATFVHLAGTLVLPYGDGTGTSSSLIYSLSRGDFQTKPNFGSGAAGDVEDGVAVWVFEVTAVRAFA